MSDMLQALVECSNAITQANGDPPGSIGLTAGQMRQLREEMRDRASRVLVSADAEVSATGEIHVMLPCGLLRCFEDDCGQGTGRLGMSGPWETGEVVRMLGERLCRDGWITKSIYGPGDMADAVIRALSAAVIGRASLESPPPAKVASDFLVATVTSTEAPMSDRMEAARLLMETGE